MTSEEDWRKRMILTSDKTENGIKEFGDSWKTWHEISKILSRFLED